MYVSIHNIESELVFRRGRPIQFLARASRKLCDLYTQVCPTPSQFQARFLASQPHLNWLGNQPGHRAGTPVYAQCPRLTKQQKHHEARNDVAMAGILCYTGRLTDNEGGVEVEATLSCDEDTWRLASNSFQLFGAGLVPLTSALHSDNGEFFHYTS